MTTQFEIFEWLATSDDEMAEATSDLIVKLLDQIEVRDAAYKAVMEVLSGLVKSMYNGEPG